MATSGLYGSTSTGTVAPQSGSESVGLYGNNTVFGGSYFNWFIFQESATQPATPTGGSWSFTTNVGTPPTGWSNTPPVAPTNKVWVSIALVNSKTTSTLTWSVPGIFSAFSGTVTSVAALTLGTTGTDVSSTVANSTTTPVITLNLPTASATNRGALSAADWTTFNSKGSGTVTSVSGTAGRVTSTGGATPVIDLASGVATPGTTGSATLVPVVTIDTYGRVTSITTAANPQGTVTSVTGTAPVVSSGGATPAISMAAANASTNGYLTSTDWSTFNSKGSGSVTSVAATVPSFLSVAGSPITTSGTLAISYSGTALPVANGGTGVTASSGANSVVLRDASVNISVNSISEGYSNVAAAGTTTTLTVASAPNYVVTGSGGQTYQLPDATTLANGVNYTFNNNQSSGTIVVKNNSSTTIATIQSGGLADISLLSNATAAGSWDVHNLAPSNVSWSTNTFDYPGSITSATWNGVAVAINRGGTGQTTQAAAITALAGTQASGQYLRSNGTNTLLSAIQAADVPTLNQNTTGTASNVTGTVAIANGGTGLTTAPANGALDIGNGTGFTRTTLTAGTGISVTNASGSITIAASGGSGTVTSVAATVPSFLSIAGSPITTSGTLAISYSGTALPVANGGTGLTSVPHTVQVFTSGSGTYTTPANVKAIWVRMVGGGGGAGGTGVGSPTAGGNGGNTTFGSSFLTCNGGTGSNPTSGSPALAGGSATGGDINITGGGGTAYNGTVTGGTGMPGGNSAFGGSGAGGGPNGAGLDAAPNSGSGGGGAGSSGASVSSTSASAGGYLEKLIASPSATYAYAVGAGGTAGAAGTNGFVGGAGGSGVIIVTEYYV